MRKVDLSAVSTSIGMPIKSGTIQHLQLAYQEALDALAKAAIGSTYDATKFYILYGCVNSTSAPTFTISAGAIFYNGEIYLVDAVTFTAGGGNTAVGTITTTQYTTNADPVEFTDGITRNVHNIRKIVFADGASGSGNVDFGNLLNYQWLQTTSTTGITLSGVGNTVTSFKMTYTHIQKKATLNFELAINLSVGATKIEAEIPYPASLVPKGTNTYIGNAIWVAGVNEYIGFSRIKTPDAFFTILVDAGTSITGDAVLYGQIEYEII